MLRVGTPTPEATFPVTDRLPSSDPSGQNAMERFSAVFEQHSRAIYGHIRTLVPNVADADEVFQETSVTLWQKFDQYRPDTDFRAWACRIAYYKVLKLRDRQSRAPRLFSPQFLDLVSEELIVMSDVLDARTEALMQCRDKLNRRDRDLLDRFHREGATAKDLARRLGRNVHYVYRAIRRIHDALFDCVKRMMSGGDA
jgi:RNA polymerase sigma-70 factor, ECF subfamily